MPTQMNHGPKQPYKTASMNSSDVNHSQSNFDGGRVTKKGGTNLSSQQKNFGMTHKAPDRRKGMSYFGEKRGTGCCDGY